MMDAYTDIFLICFLIILGVLTRTLLHIGQNIEFVTGSCLAAGYFLHTKKLSWVVPFVVMVITDLLIGNSIIFLFTWSAFLCAPLFSKLIDTKHEYLSAIQSGALFTFFFFLWTNFGVVVTSTLYPKTIEGLIHSYINGLPFLVNQLIGNLFIVPILFFILNMIYKFSYHNLKKEQY